jgi:hypothetical protein
MYRWLLEQGEAVQMSNPTDNGAGKAAAVTEQAQGKTKEGTDGAAMADDEITLPLEVQRLVNTIMRPYLIGTSKGRCVLGLLLR